MPDLCGPDDHRWYLCVYVGEIFAVQPGATRGSLKPGLCILLHMICRLESYLTVIAEAESVASIYNPLLDAKYAWMARTVHRSELATGISTYICIHNLSPRTSSCRHTDTPPCLGAPPRVACSPCCPFRVPSCRVWFERRTENKQSASTVSVLSRKLFLLHVDSLLSHQPRLFQAKRGWLPKKTKAP